jgi:hypothetical protein
VGSSGAELRHNPLSFQLKTRLLRARERERPDIIKKHPLKTSKTLKTYNKRVSHGSNRPEHDCNDSCSISQRSGGVVLNTLEPFLIAK